MTVTSKQTNNSVSRGDAVYDIVMHVVSLGIVYTLWLGGAYFSNQALTAVLGWFGYGYNIEGWRWYVAPVAFSVVEIVGWERRRTLAGWILWLAATIAALDFATSVFGVAVTVAGKTVPLMNGWAIPASATSATPIIIGIIVSVILTFPPERVTISALAALRTSLMVLRRTF